MSSLFPDFEMPVKKLYRTDMLPSLADACVEILSERLMPMEVSQLTREAIRRVGVVGVSFGKIREDIREKVLAAGRRGMVYLRPEQTGYPTCLAGLRLWFRSQMAYGTDIYIPANLDAAAAACAELVMRRKYLSTVHDTYDRWLAGGRGYIIEHHVSRYFRERFPTLWLPPDNRGQWTVACEHDFKLKLLSDVSRVVEVDVLGPRADGRFGRPLCKGKKTTSKTWHILASMSANHVTLHGAISGSTFSRIGDEGISGEHSEPVQRIIVWCNCVVAGWDYWRMRNSLNAQRPFSIAESAL